MIDLVLLREFLFWCTVINMGVLLFASLVVRTAGGWLYETQGKWFSIPEEKFNVVVYAVLGVYKFMVLLFCVIPWIALLIIL
ncbi:MAG: hypothetical protein EA427_02100 [Spirochaetaceae bacterium]|nr:MAG: hypothetical protein EA427_02100 [Spirochaetaceae bacterium]